MTNTRRALSTLLISLFTVSSAWAVHPFMPRTPAISPDGSTVVFSFQGDLWKVPSTGGQAIRLTAHPAYDTAPVFSPDGKTLAFASSRYDDDDVFLMPANGGAPARLTYASTNDIPQAFSPDGKTLYFSSARPFKFPMDRQIYKVSVSGGTPFRAFDFFADEASVFQDGSFALGIGRVKFGRRHYRGTYQREIYHYVPGSDPVRITDHPGYDMNPLAGPGNPVYWITDADETMTCNLWSMKADGSEKTQLTNFTNEDVRSAKISQGGSTFILEVGSDLYLLDNAPGAQPKKLEIDVAADLIQNPIVIEDKTGGADELSTSSDGAEYALIINGDIVFVSKELGGRATVPFASPSREQEIAFRPGGAKELLFISDQNGQQQLFKLTPKGDAESLREAKDFTITEMTGRETPAHHPVWSPDGEKILYTIGNGDLHVMDADGKNDKLLLARWHQKWSSFDYTWSPDSRWVALSVEDPDYNSDIWILPADSSGKPVNISKHPKEDFGPVWSEDGSLLAWTSSRHNRQHDVYAVYLRREDDEKTRVEWENWQKTRDKAKNDDEDKDKDKKKKKDKDKEEIPKVVIDFEDIHNRVRSLTSLPGNESVIAIHPKGDKFFFLTTIDGSTDLYSVDRFGEELTNVTSGDASPDAVQLVDGTFHFLKSGQPANVSMDGGSVESTDFSARLTVDRPARRLQAIQEGWRVMRDHFYDPDMHGVDWDSIKDKYFDWARNVADDSDFSDVVNLMLGELNASHMGYYQHWAGPRGDNDGWLGLRFDPAFAGPGLLVTGVLPYGPSDKVKSRILPGDIVLKIDGLDVGPDKNIFAALEKRSGMPTEVVLQRGKKTTERFEIVPAGLRDISNLSTDLWERDNRKVVETASDGHVGYVYITGMSWPEVERFEMNLFAAADGKDALIIDVRGNGGGWTTDFMLNILTQPQHAFTVGRGGEPGYPQAERQIFYRWEKPIAVLCDESSYSNAEIFSHAIKTIGRGPLVGNTTGGNVISTDGWFTLIPDAWIRLPQRGWYVWGDKANPDRNGMNEEGHGAVPDYLIVRTPADILNNRDPQLDKAVELMEAAAKEQERLPLPAPKE
ncbi:MAG: S41 family peptidase [bacterium]